MYRLIVPSLLAHPNKGRDLSEELGIEYSPEEKNNESTDWKRMLGKDSRLFFATDCLACSSEVGPPGQ